MTDPAPQPTAASPEIVAFASRMYDAARKGDTAIFEQALPAGLPPNMTNDKGDSLVWPLNLPSVPAPSFTNSLP